jgi:iron uptake system EfeUOB component EfeO/EfeM
MDWPQPSKSAWANCVALVMPRRIVGWPFLGLAAVLAAVLALVFTHGGSAAGPATGAQSPYGAAPLAIYQEEAPHVTSSLIIYGLQGEVRGAGAAPAGSLSPVPAADFAGPVAAYLAYARAQLGPMESQISDLDAALAAGNRNQAENAWRGAFADYLKLGAVYLEGPIESLNQAIDGGPGGLPGGTASPQFSGLHRLEFGLWTGASLSSLEPWARQLASDVSQLRDALPSVQISPLDYATRAHEILEDAVRDLLSGTDVRWSGEGVLGTDAGLVATTEVIKTLTPLLRTREGVLPAVNTDLAALRSTLASLQRAHGGALPTNSQLTQLESEQLDASMGQALEALAQVPGALETAKAPAIPAIPKKAFKLDP